MFFNNYQILLFYYLFLPFEPFELLSMKSFELLLSIKPFELFSIKPFCILGNNDEDDEM